MSTVHVHDNHHYGDDDVRAHHVSTFDGHDGGRGGDAPSLCFHGGDAPSLYSHGGDGGGHVYFL